MGGKAEKALSATEALVLAFQDTASTKTVFQENIQRVSENSEKKSRKQFPREMISLRF